MIIISGYFGAQFSRVYPAPHDFNSVFFSNNPELKAEACRKGWVFKYVKSIPLSGDYRISSLQSKYVKFLQFGAEFCDLDLDQEILYFDHKFKVELEHIKFINLIANKDILIRNTPRLKTSIQHEIDDAMGQERYKVVMQETISWLNSKVSSGDYSYNNRIMNTGLIFYRRIHNVKPLLDEVYKNCWLLGQPECQIIWGLLSQKYDHLIKRVEWNELNPLWKLPES